jgi:Rrf2 family protein
MVDTRFSLSLQIMMTLAHHGEDLMNSAQLAKILKSNPTFIRKLTARLVDADLVTSFRGKTGGIRLAQKPSSICLKQIYAAATEQKSLMSCHSKPVIKACPVSCCIEDVLNEVVDGINHATLQYLQKKTLADMMKQVQ